MERRCRRLPPYSPDLNPIEQAFAKFKALGAGAESRQQIGWVIVGGMSLGTLLTIFVVPTVYMLFARKRVPGEIATPEAAEATVKPSQLSTRLA